MHVLRLPDLRLRNPYTLLPQPNAIDEWLGGNNIDSFASMGDIPSDHVLCTVQIVTTPIYREDFFRYDLMFYVEVPETSGIDVAYFSSPIVTLGRYEGHFSDASAPKWTHIAIGVAFDIRQPCGPVAAVFTELAFWPENVEIKGLARAMLTWAQAVSSIKPSGRQIGSSFVVAGADQKTHPAEVRCRGQE